MLGCDVVYNNKRTNDEVIITAVKQDRIIFTKNVSLIQYYQGFVHFIKGQSLKSQLIEIAQKFDIELKISFKFCPVGNGNLVISSKEKIRRKIPEYIYRTHDKLYLCE